VACKTLRSSALIARIPAGRSGADLYGDTPTTLQQERHLHTVAELQTRLTLSFVVTPHTSIKLENLDQAREYVRAYLMPMITGPGSRQS
jgi:hypothetical protein